MAGKLSVNKEHILWAPNFVIISVCSLVKPFISIITDTVLPRIWFSYLIERKKEKTKWRRRIKMFYVYIRMSSHTCNNISNSVKINFITWNMLNFEGSSCDNHVANIIHFLSKPFVSGTTHLTTKKYFCYLVSRIRYIEITVFFSKILWRFYGECTRWRFKM